MRIIHTPRTHLLAAALVWSLSLFVPPPAQAQAGRGVGVDARQQQAQQQPPANVTQLPGKSKRWALIIGVDQYRDSQIGRLSGAANDARMLASALTTYAGFPADQVLLLATDQPEERQPTRVNILRRLSNLTAVVPKDGLLLVSFAGHGMERNGQAFLLPSDAQISEDISFLEETAISVTRMKERIKTTGVGQVLILLDACRNDPGGRADAPNLMTNAYTKFNFDVRNHEVQAFATLYATAVGQRAYEYSEKHQGYFTWALVEGLKGGAANEKGEITLSALVKYVQDIVPKRIGIDLGTGKLQRPFAIVEGYKADELVVAASSPVAVAAAAATPGAPPPPVDASVFEMSFWDAIKNSNDPADFRAYLDKFPNGTFAALARRRAEPAPSRPPNTTPAGGSPYVPERNQPTSTPLDPASVSETLNQAARDYQDKSYGHVIETGRSVLSAQPDNGRANLLVGLSYLQTGKYTNSANHLTRALAAGERVDVPIKHHHYVFLIGDQFCEGYVSFTSSAFEFHSTSQGGHEFSVPYTKLYEMVVEQMHGGRLRVKVGIQKEKKEDKKTYNFYLTRAYTARNPQGSVMDAHCDSCVGEVQELAQLFQQLVVTGSAKTSATGTPPADGAAGAGGGEQAQVLQELLDIERRTFDAIQLGDKAVVESFMADEFVQKEGGKTYTKAQLLAAIRPSSLKLSYSYEDVKLNLTGDTAVLTGIAVLRGQRGGAMVAVRQQFTDTFVRRNGRWLVISSEVTTLK